MAHVRVQRLRARYGKHHGAERQKGGQRIAREESESVHRKNRRQDRRLVRHFHQTKGRDRSEPQAHHRAEQPPDARCAVTLNPEQPHQHRKRDRNHVGLERWRNDLEALDGR